MITRDQGVRFVIREADAGLDRDPEGIARTFRETYENYPFTAFTEEDSVREDVIPGESTVLVVEIPPGQTVDGEDLQDSEVIGTGSVKPQKDGRLAELGSAVLHPDYQGMEDTNFYQELLDERLRRAEEADIVYTQPVSGLHAITQHEHEKRNFAVFGLSLSKYPEVFAGEGRETVVPMIDAESDFDYVASKLEPGDSPEIYLPDENEMDADVSLEQLVDKVLGGINERREKSRLARDPVTGIEDSPDQRYVMRKKTDDTEVAEMVEYEIVPEARADPDEEDIHVDEVERILEEKKDNDEYRWIGVELDANHPASVEIMEALMARGYEPEKFMPEKLYSDDIPGDVVGLQYREDDTGQIELIDEATNLAERAGLEPSLVDDTGLGFTKYAYI